MARLKSIKNKPFLADLYQVFNFNSPEELEKKRASFNSWSRLIHFCKKISSSVIVRVKI